MEHRSNATSRRDFMRLLVGTTAVLGSGAIAACSADHHGGPARGDETSGRPVGDGQALDVTSFGALGDGRSDDSDAIEQALAALRPGGALTFPRGKVFCHSRVLAVATPDVRILGPGQLLATQEAASALRIDADGVEVDGLSLSVSRTTQRWTTPDQHKIYVGPHGRIVIRNVSITGSAAAGLFCYGASGFTLHNVHVSGTRADGIHMTNGCRDGHVESPVTMATGDDGIAVVSYASDAKPCRNILVNGARIHGTTGGRGMSVVGGSDVTYKDIGIMSSNAAALYIACEGGDFVSYPTSRVIVNGGRIMGANTNSQIDHGAVLVYSGRSGNGVADVRVSNLTITDTRPSASRQIGVVADGPADTVAGIAFDDITLEARPTPYEGNAALTGLALHNVRASGAAVLPSVTR